MISTKPSTAGVMRGCSAQWLHSRTSQPPTSTPEHPTHSCHRGGTAGRRQDGSSARCTNSQGMWHRWCSGGGYIRWRRMCLGCEWAGGQSGDWGSHGALCCSLRDPGPVPVPTQGGRPVSLALCFCQLISLRAGVRCLSEAARRAGAPCTPPPRPRLPLALASHLGGSGSSRGDAWIRSIPFPGLRSFGSPCGMGAPSRGDGIRRVNYSGVSWEEQSDIREDGP